MSFGIDILIHVANLLYLIAFMVRDVLWLRVFAVVASFCLIAYFSISTSAADNSNILEHRIHGPERLLDSPIATRASSRKVDTR